MSRSVRDVKGRPLLRGETIRVHYTTEIRGRERVEPLLRGLARSVEAQGIVRVLSVDAQESGGWVRYRIVKNPWFIPLLLGALGGSYFVVDRVVDEAVGSGSGAGVSLFSGLTPVLAIGLAAAALWVVARR